jgi:hypothetical protein
VRAHARGRAEDARLLTSAQGVVDSGSDGVDAGVTCDKADPLLPVAVKATTRHIITSANLNPKKARHGRKVTYGWRSWRARVSLSATLMYWRAWSRCPRCRCSNATPAAPV